MLPLIWVECINLAGWLMSESSCWVTGRNQCSELGQAEVLVRHRSARQHVPLAPESDLQRESSLPHTE
jgi:hypothetical protein